MSPALIFPNLAPCPPHATNAPPAAATTRVKPTPHTHARDFMPAIVSNSHAYSPSHAVASSLPLSFSSSSAAPWHFLNFWPLPQGHGSFRPIFGPSRRTGCTVTRGAGRAADRGGGASSSPEAGSDP